MPYAKIEHEIAFVKSGRGKAQCAPNPDYPNGIAIKINETPKCEAVLPYPAPECGHWKIECCLCRTTVAVTAAGRPDDPISIEIPCQFKGKVN